MNVSYVCYDANGTIRRYGSCDESQYDVQQAGEYTKMLGEGTYDGHYVDAGEIHEKTEMEPMVTGMVISGIPNPSTLTVEGVAYPVTDGEAEFTFDFPGTYAVKIESTKHFPKTVSLVKA